MTSYAKIDKWRAANGTAYNNVVQVVQSVLTQGDSTASFSGGQPAIDYNVNQYSYAYGFTNATTYETMSGALSPAGWWVVPDFSAKITPKYASSKILVMLDLIYGCSYWEAQGRIMRNGVAIGLGKNRGDRQPVTFADNNYEYAPSAQYSQYSTYKASVLIMDDPFGYESGSGTDATITSGPVPFGTTLTYYVELNSHSGSTLSINRPQYNNNDSSYYAEPISTLTLMEVTA